MMPKYPTVKFKANDGYEKSVPFTAYNDGPITELDLGVLVEINDKQTAIKNTYLITGIKNYLYTRGYMLFTMEKVKS